MLFGANPDTETRVLDGVRAIRRRDAHVAIILVSTRGSEALAVAALRAGVTDYFASPIAGDELAERVRRELSPRRAVNARVAAVAGPPLIGASAAMRDLRRDVERMAANDLSVVITGETGTGKEVVAQHLHGQSPRRHGPFVPVNCAAMPDTLVESELFGHERGAFTGAVAGRVGHIQAAHRGTIFFDEIGDMGAQAQAKILRVVESGEVTRLGDRRPVPVNVRIVAATNQDLDRAMTEGRFRKDLYFRLNVARIVLPPLRERRDDIPGLLEYYASRAHPRGERAERVFTPDALDLLGAYDWPGNVRELKNLVDLALADHPAGVIGVADLPESFRRRMAGSASGGERQRLLHALAETDWNKSQTARTLHWSRMTLYRKLAKYHLVSGGDPAK